MANKVPSMYFRYFVYSEQEADLFHKAHGINATLGDVVVNGIAKKYTSIVLNMDEAKSDAILLVKGDIRKIRHTPHKKK